MGVKTNWMDVRRCMDTERAAPQVNVGQSKALLLWRTPVGLSPILDRKITPMDRETLADMIGQKDAIKLAASIMAAKAIANLERSFSKVKVSDGRSYLRSRVCFELRRMASGVSKGTYSAVSDLEKVHRDCQRRIARRKGKQ